MPWGTGRGQLLSLSCSCGVAVLDKVGRYPPSLHPCTVAPCPALDATAGPLTLSFTLSLQEILQLSEYLKVRLESPPDHPSTVSARIPHLGPSPVGVPTGSTAERAGAETENGAAPRPASYARPGLTEFLDGKRGWRVGVLLSIPFRTVLSPLSGLFFLVHCHLCHTHPGTIPRTHPSSALPWLQLSGCRCP